MTAPQPRDSRAIASSRAIVLAAVLLATGLALHGISDAWEEGFRGINGGFYHGNFVRHYLEAGLAATHGAAAIKSIPGNPPTLFFDHHHPTGYPLALAAAAAVFGLSELTLRVTALLMFLPAVVGLAALARRFGGGQRSGVAALLLVLFPLGGYWGPMVSADGGVLSAGLWTLVLFVDQVRAPARWRGLALALLYVVGGSLDWGYHFFGAACFLIAWLLPERRRALITVAALAVVSCVPIGIWAVQGIAVYGSVKGLGAALETIFDHSARTSPTLGVFAGTVGGYAWKWITWPGLAALALGLVLGWRRRSDGTPDPLPRLAAILIVPGVLMCTFLPGHAVVHDFWILHSLPGVALFAACGIDAVARRFGAQATTVAIVLTLAAGVPGGVRTWVAVEEHRTTRFRDTAALVSSLLEPGDIVCTTASFDIESYYIPTFVFPFQQTVEAFDLAVKGLALLPPGVKRMVYVMGPEWAGSALDQSIAARYPREVHGGWIVYRVPR